MVSLPEEIIYADDTDILSLDQREKAKVLNTIFWVFPERNLQINADKTNHTEKRGEESGTMERGEKAGILTWWQGRNSLEKTTIHSCYEQHG